MNPRYLASFVVLALFVSGCGESDKAASSTTTTSAPSTTTTAPDPAADTATAQKFLLTAADMPGGWVASLPRSETAEDKADYEKLNACAGMPPLAETHVANVYGNEFSQGDNAITSVVTSLKTSQLVERDFAATTDPKNFPCISGVFNELVKKGMGDVGPGATVTSTIEPLTGITTADNQFALRISCVISVAGQTLNAYVDLIGVRHDRFEITNTVTFMNTPPPADLDRSLLQASVAKVNGVSSV